MDTDGKLYTRNALVHVLGLPYNAPLAFTTNWEKRMTAETHDKWHRRFRWVPNTPENAKTYNFEESVITGCYAQRNKKMMELTTYTELEIAHRLGGAYSGRCLHWHGHRYEVEITVTAQKLNKDGMIIDFKKLKEVVKTVLDDKWDHGACVRADDPLAHALMGDAHHERVHIIAGNPTLEWMVEHWALELQKALDNFCPGVAVSMLKASETARNTVTWRCNCLPWERSEPANDAKKPICADKEKERVDAALRPAPKRDWASPGATVKVDTFMPTEGIEAEIEEVHPDAVPYLVSFYNNHTIGSTVVYSSLKAQALYDFCTGAVQPLDKNEEAVVVTGITRLQG